MPDDLPPFTADPVDRLRHTMAAFDGEPGDDWAVVATSNYVPGHPQTGLTYDDLRAILARLDQ